MGHIAGFICDRDSFDRHLQTQNVTLTPGTSATILLGMLVIQTHNEYDLEKKKILSQTKTK
ncbi:MAG: hypothetical protein HC820_09765 [Hydrococcus sp. RM1_1_31]|nr:hypothetical protein [Hydrococcus sp. RM1_1_31]